MRFGMNSYKIENDEVVVNATVSDPEVVADAQEAAGDIQEVVQLCDAVEAYSEVSEGVSDLGAEAAEAIEANPSDAEAEEVSVKLERDLQCLLAKVNGTVRSSRFGGSSLGKKIESDFSLKGKRGLIARQEGISEAGKKVWEHIKAFFAKIWDFMKSLFERFTALFKSNKSVLEGLKAKLEKEEDSKYDSIKKGATESQQLTFYHSYGKEYVKNIGNLVDVLGKNMENQVKVLKGEAKNPQHKDEKTIVSVIKLADGDLDGLNKLNSFLGFGVSGEGVLGLSIEKKGSGDSSKEVKQVKTLKIKKSSFEKSKDFRENLISICEYGIDLCEELDGSLIKDTEKTFNDARKEAEDVIKELFDKDDETKNSPELKESQKAATKTLTYMVSSFSKIIATVGNQPSQVVTAVRNGMSMCEAAKN